jgi:hypothetical protein
VITTGLVIPLRPLFPTRALFSFGEWFQFSMPSLYGPTHRVLFLNHRRVDRALGTIRDHPVPVAVRGDSLEKRHFKRDFLEFNRDARWEWCISPLDRLQRDITLFLTQTDEAIFFQSSDKKLSNSMNQFDIFRRGLPTVQQDRSCLNSFIGISAADHFPKMIVFRFAISIRFAGPAWTAQASGNARSPATKPSINPANRSPQSV